MSVYNHRPMVPTPQNRIIEVLDAIRAEFDKMTQDIYLYKSEKDEFEHKMAQQTQEMSNFQQSLSEIERSQQTLKKQYEDEIARLRQQLEQAQSRTGGGGGGGSNGNSNGSISNGHSELAPGLIPASSAGLHTHQPPPPNIGPGSNYFGGIMNAHGQGPLGLVAPPQMSESNYPLQAAPLPSAPSNYISSTGPPMYQGPTKAMSQPPPPATAAPPPATTPSGPYHPKEEWHPGYGFSQRASNTPAVQNPMDMNSGSKRKSGSIPPGPPSGQMIMPTGRPAPKAQTGAAITGNLADVDPESVPANMKTEGKDWFALFNPKVPRSLQVNLMHTLEHSSVVCCVKFSADGRFLAAGCNRSTYIYDAVTSQRICTLQDDNVQKDGDLYIRAVCFSPDGVYLATGAEDKQIRIWDIAKKRIYNVFVGHEQDIYSLDFSRDGRIIVSGSGDRTARIWSMSDGQCLHVLRIKDVDQKDPGITSVAVSPDSRFVAAGSLDKMVRVWDTYTGNFLEKLDGHKDSVYSVAFMPDGKTLVSGSLDKTLKLWKLGTHEGRGYGVDRDRSKGPCKMTFSGHKDFVLSVACTPDGNWVVSGSKDRGVQFWDPRTGQTQFMLQGHKNSVISVAISPAGRPMFATGSGDNLARIWSYDPFGP
ncbi:WD40-repeat-containing domain protein [Phycomyces nitens]|nr:WD40-repeat-containing domain protein [Phycomyces nitens]